MKNLKLLILILAVAPAAFSHAASLKSMLGQKDVQTADGVYEETLVFCMGGKEFAIRRKKDDTSAQWCGVDAEGFCSISKVGAGKKVCQQKYSRAIETLEQAAENTTHPEPEPELEPKVSPREETPKQDIHLANTDVSEEQSVQQNPPVTTPDQEELSAVEIKESAQSEQEALDMAERRLEIERQRLEIRKQELELQKQAFELQQKMKAEEATPKKQAESATKKQVATEDKSSVPVLFRESMAQ